jgi:hypothetical protein
LVHFLCCISDENVVNIHSTAAEGSENQYCLLHDVSDLVVHVESQKYYDDDKFLAAMRCCTAIQCSNQSNMLTTTAKSTSHWYLTVMTPEAVALKRSAVCDDWFEQHTVYKNREDVKASTMPVDLDSSCGHVMAHRAS